MTKIISNLISFCFININFVMIYRVVVLSYQLLCWLDYLCLGVPFCISRINYNFDLNERERDWNVWFSNSKKRESEWTHWEIGCNTIAIYSKNYPQRSFVYEKKKKKKLITINAINISVTHFNESHRRVIKMSSALSFRDFHLLAN